MKDFSKCVSVGVSQITLHNYRRSLCSQQEEEASSVGHVPASVGSREVPIGLGVPAVGTPRMPRLRRPASGSQTDRMHRLGPTSAPHGAGSLPAGFLELLASEVSAVVHPWVEARPRPHPSSWEAGRGCVASPRGGRTGAQLRRGTHCLWPQGPGRLIHTIPGPRTPPVTEPCSPKVKV